MDYSRLSAAQKADYNSRRMRCYGCAASTPHTNTQTGTESSWFWPFLSFTFLGLVYAILDVTTTDACRGSGFAYGSPGAFYAAQPGKPPNQDIASLSSAFCRSIPALSQHGDKCGRPVTNLDYCLAGSDLLADEGGAVGDGAHELAMLQSLLASQEAESAVFCASVFEAETGRNGTLPQPLVLMSWECRKALIDAVTPEIIFAVIAFVIAVRWF
ncbi:hypothetical protein MN608_04257 [Microdochium nivale]|nr:hypothetical protein MN608_04257 [Microdochium nivale]